MFRLVANFAKNVLLAADFTDWLHAPIPMVKSGAGMWNIKVPLLPGRYHYRFLIDHGSPSTQAGDGRFALPFGTLHGVVEVRAA